MSSLTNINNNTRVVNVGRTTPVAPGQQPAAKSIPVVLASDQTAVPVIEQNKVQSEVSLSLLGIPRSEVALGIFADVNTYDVNPTEWSSSPQYYNKGPDGSGFGIKHLPTEAGALVEAPRDKSAVLTSKRFFRYQPGRVSAATFGVKTSVNDSHYARNPVIRKYGIFDNFDGYYWESTQSGQGDNFSVVRRTQSLLKFPGSPFGLTDENLRKPTGSSVADKQVPFNQTDDYRATGKEGSELKGKYFTREREELVHDSIALAEAMFDRLSTTNNNALYTYYDTDSNFGSTAEERAAARAVYKDKCHRDAKFWLDMIIMDLEWGGDAHTKINTKNYTTALLNASGNAEVALYTELKKLVLDDDNVNGGSTLTNKFHSPSTKSYATGAARSKISTLFNVPIDFFSSGTAQATRYQSFTNSMSYGDKSRVDTLFDTRKHYWSYFVSSFLYDSTDVDNKQSGNYQTYTFQTNSINDLFMPQGHDFSDLVGYVITSDPSSAKKYPFSAGQQLSPTDLPNSQSAIILSDIQALALNEYYQNIKYKCARDLEYVINGYKNDLMGGGNAETLYNASMYYKGAGLSIYTQTDAGVPQEVAKHRHLVDWINEDLNDSTISGSGSVAMAKELDALGNTDGPVLTGLSKIIIDNFGQETLSGVELGNRGFAGNIVVFRDGLMMTHAATRDPNLLKDVEQIKAHVYEAPAIDQPTRFKITKGGVTFGQKVKVITTTGSATKLSDNNNITLGTTVVEKPEALYGEIYTVSRVYGPTGNEFSLRNQNGEDIYAYVSGQLVSERATPHEIYVETVVPFIGDVVYNPGNYRLPYADRIPSTTIQNLDGSASQVTYGEADDPFPIGMQWPLRYSSTNQLSDTTANYIGYIDTAQSPTNLAGVANIRSQYDEVNFNPEYINWIKNNVKPEYWGVYEYRIPRSRFSHDKLDGKTSKRLYSDLATGNTGIVRPGMEVLDEDGVWVDAVSEYEFDFTKVTMLKIEFSWYGAVGALFLAYVPIGNGEARWVRVHHLRASNQLKIASLGNATLPITYNVYGGGSVATLGDGETKTHTYGTSQSHHIVKYGASYYIDGGDRGTVRLYSHNNNDVVAAHGKQWLVDNGNPTYTDHSFGVSFDMPSDGKTIAAPGGVQVDLPHLVYFMGAQIKTDNPVDTGIRVVWIDEAAQKIYLNKTPQGQTLTLIPDRADLVYGLETKDIIYSTLESNPVRNRVQVYPTKMSTANMDQTPVRLRMKRTPIFQTLTPVNINHTLTLNSDYVVTPESLPMSVTESNAPYIQNGEEIFGWYQGVIGDVDDETIFGRLYKQSNNYYFEVLQSFNDVVVLKQGGIFLPDQRFVRDSGQNGALAVSTVPTANEVPLADTLTSVNAVNNVVVPIPNTGSNVATLYLQPNGTEQVNLDTYFDYNKEYLSYPLTDQAETLYFAVDADKPVDVSADVAIGLTWEEQ